MAEERNGKATKHPAQPPEGVPGFAPKALFIYVYGRPPSVWKNVGTAESASWKKVV